MAFHSTLLAPPVDCWRGWFQDRFLGGEKARRPPAETHGLALLRWHPGLLLCRNWSGAQLRAGWGRSICYLHCSCGHAFAFSLPVCQPPPRCWYLIHKSVKLPGFNVDVDVYVLTINNCCFFFFFLKGNCWVSLPLSLRRIGLGWCWLERLKHLADGPLGAGENVCICLTVQNKREKQVGAGM